MPIKIRTATPADGPRIAAIVLAASVAEQPWSSYMPMGVKQNAEYVTAVERLIKGYIEASDTEWIVEVAEANRNDSAGRPIIASVAVWDTRAAPPPARRSSSIVSNRSKKEAETNKGAPTWSDDWSIDPENAELEALNKAFADGKKKYFPSTGPQVFLRLVATAPDHQRRGYGKALCQAGLEMAWQRQASVCVQTATKGYIALSGLGFSQIGVTDLPTIPGHDDPVLKALKLDVSKGQEAHPSFVTSLWNYVRN